MQNYECLTPSSVNDIIIFCDSDCKQKVNFCRILTWFEGVSSLRINLANSLIIAQVEHSIACKCLVCNIDSLPTTYLGLLLGAKFKEKALGSNH